MNFKRVNRIWKEEHMQVPQKQRKRRRLPGGECHWVRSSSGDASESCLELRLPHGADGGHALMSNGTETGNGSNTSPLICSPSRDLRNSIMRFLNTFPSHHPSALSFLREPDSFPRISTLENICSPRPIAWMPIWATGTKHLRGAAQAAPMCSPRARTDAH